MKSKKWIVLPLLLVLALLVWYIVFRPRTVEKTVLVPLPSFRLAEQVTSPVNLVKWLVPFSYEGANPETKIYHDRRTIVSASDSVHILAKSVFSTDLRFFSEKESHLVHLNILPDTANPDASLLTMRYKTTRFREWTGSGNALQNAKKSLVNLQEYMSDTKRLYGYEIRLVTVVDTSFLFLRETVPIAEKRAATRKIFEHLISYAEKRNAGYNGIRIFYSVKSGETVTLFASIGVTNQVSTDEKEGIEYKMMPFDKKLLEAVYQGPFGESDKAFRALEQFKTDHNFTSMAIPFQKFLSDGYDFADDQIVQLKVYYPVF